jgi:hypothetical protein
VKFAPCRTTAQLTGWKQYEVTHPRRGCTRSLILSRDCISLVIHASSISSHFSNLCHHFVKVDILLLLYHNSTRSNRVVVGSSSDILARPWRPCFRISHKVWLFAPGDFKYCAVTFALSDTCHGKSERSTAHCHLSCSCMMRR